MSTPISTTSTSDPTLTLESFPSHFTTFLLTYTTPFDLILATIFLCFSLYKFGAHRQNFLATATLIAAYLGRKAILPATNLDGWDPGNDTVGPGIYGGKVLYDEKNNIVYGKQYQNHNPFVDGPVYEGKGAGYSFMNSLLRAFDVDGLETALERDPGLSLEISTGGATPLHFAGMIRIPNNNAAKNATGKGPRGSDGSRSVGETIPSSENAFYEEKMRKMVKSLLQACLLHITEEQNKQKSASKARGGGTSSTTVSLSPVDACINKNIDLWGYTPLHRAAGNEAVAVLQELVAVESVDLNVMSTGVYNLYGGPETPLETARRESAVVATRFLEEIMEKTEGESSKATPTDANR
ncbi:unnamed protein product [Amoebophrya sp. A120]|nr:unnamed protein product [Amoebophrya sp. A120]|eukprot:GSA120T00010363001.1